MIFHSVVVLQLTLVLSLSFQLWQSVSQVPGSIQTFDVSSDGTILATGNTDTKIRVYSFKDSTYTIQNILTQSIGTILSVKISYDKQILISGSMDSILRVYLKSNSGYMLGQTLTQSSGFINSVAITDDNKWLIAGSGDHKCRIYKNTNNIFTLTQTLNEATDVIRTVTITNNGSKLITGGKDGSMRIYKINTSNTTFLFNQTVTNTPLYSVSIIDDVIMTGNGDIPLQWRIYRQGKSMYYVTQLVTSATAVASVTMSQDKQRLVVGTFDHLIRYYEDINTAVDSYNLTQKLSEATGAISSVKLSNNGGYLYTASLDGYLRIYYQCLSGCKQCDEFLKCGECLEQYNMNSGVCISDNTPIEKNNVLSIALHSVFGVLLLVGIVCVLIFCQLKKSSSISNASDVVMTNETNPTDGNQIQKTEYQQKTIVDRYNPQNTTMDFFLQGNTVDTRPKTVLRARRRKVRGGKQDGNLEVINVGEQQQEQVTPPSECQSSQN